MRDWGRGCLFTSYGFLLASRLGSEVWHVWWWLRSAGGANLRSAQSTNELRLMFIPNLLLTLSLLFPAAQLRRELLGPSAAVLHPTVNLRARLSAAPPAWLPVSVRCRLPRTAAAPVVAPAEGNEAAVAPTRPARAAARAVPAPTSTSTLVGRREDRANAKARAGT